EGARGEGERLGGGQVLVGRQPGAAALRDRLRGLDLFLRGERALRAGVPVMSVVHGSNRNLRRRRLVVGGLCRSGVDLRGSTGALPASPIMDRALRRR